MEVIEPSIVYAVSNIFSKGSFSLFGIMTAKYIYCVAAMCMSWNNGSFWLCWQSIQVTCKHNNTVCMLYGQSKADKRQAEGTVTEKGEFNRLW